MESGLRLSVVVQEDGGQDGHLQHYTVWGYRLTCFVPWIACLEDLTATFRGIDPDFGRGRDWRP
jgi:hypothetical protein